MLLVASSGLPVVVGVVCAEPKAMKERTSKGDQPPSPSQVSAPPLGETYRRTLDQDWTISMLMELQKTVSGQEVTLNHVAENVTELKGTVRRIEKIIIGATAVVAVVGALILWMVNTAKDVYIATHEQERIERNASLPADTHSASTPVTKQQPSSERK